MLLYLTRASEMAAPAAPKRPMTHTFWFWRGCHDIRGKQPAVVASILACKSRNSYSDWLTVEGLWRDRSDQETCGAPRSTSASQA